MSDETKIINSERIEALEKRVANLEQKSKEKRIETITITDAGCQVDELHPFAGIPT
jgi:hypothetical protein